MANTDLTIKKFQVLTQLPINVIVRWSKAEYDIKNYGHILISQEYKAFMQLYNKHNNPVEYGYLLYRYLDLYHKIFDINFEIKEYRKKKESEKAGLKVELTKILHFLRNNDNGKPSSLNFQKSRDSCKTESVEIFKAIEEKLEDVFRSNEFNIEYLTQDQKNNLDKSSYKQYWSNKTRLFKNIDPAINNSLTRKHVFSKDNEEDMKDIFNLTNRDIKDSLYFFVVLPVERVINFMFLDELLKKQDKPTKPLGRPLSRRYVEDFMIFLATFRRLEKFLLDQNISAIDQVELHNEDFMFIHECHDFFVPIKVAYPKSKDINQAIKNFIRGTFSNLDLENSENKMRFTTFRDEVKDQLPGTTLK